MERVVNEEKRKKFIEYAGKRVNNVLHDIQILEPMARSNTYDFTRKDVEDMFNAIQETLNEAKEEFNKKFDERAKAEKKTFSFAAIASEENESLSEDVNINETTTFWFKNHNHTFTHGLQRPIMAYYGPAYWWRWLLLCSESKNTLYILYKVFALFISNVIIIL